MKNHKQQLRVGNILHHIGLGICKVLGIHNDGSIHICDIRDNAKQHLVLGKFTYRLEPVLLTKEWLLKLGFKEDAKNVQMIRKDIAYRISHFQKEVTLYQNKNQVTVPNIKFVHELQNLYYTLTGKELLFNEYVNDFPKDEFIDENDDI